MRALGPLAPRSGGREQLRVALIGLGGYGGTVFRALLELHESQKIRLAAVASSSIEKRRAQVGIAIRYGASVFNNLDELLVRDACGIQVVVLPVAIGAHRQLSCKALHAGMHVMCEKPIAGDIGDAGAMIDSARNAGRRLIISFQHLYSRSVRAIARLARQRSLGRLVGAHTIVSWPRPDSYYTRNQWAGSLTLHGVAVRDCPIQNATAHYLQNMLWVARNDEESSRLSSVYAESYRCRAEAPDTQYVRAQLSSGAVISIAATHSSTRRIEPVTMYTFENGIAVWRHPGELTIQQGRVLLKTIVNDSVDLTIGALGRMVDDIAVGRASPGDAQHCLQHTHCVEESCRIENIFDVESVYFRSAGCYEIGDDKTRTGQIRVIEGLPELILNTSTASGFWDAGAPWGRQGSLS